MGTEIANQNTFEAQLNTQLRHAEVMAQADMIPDKFKKKPANVLVAQEMAREMGETAMTIMSELYFVGNIPTFSAKFMASRARSAGHIVRQTFDESTQTAKCVIIRKDDPDFEHTVTWDRAKAEAHGLWGKGHWKKNPQLMLENRAVSECVRKACNEVTGGVDYTREEAEAMQTVKATATRKDRPTSGAAGVRAALTKAKPEAEPEPETTPEPEADDEPVEVEGVIDEPPTAEAFLSEISSVTTRDELEAVMGLAKQSLPDDEYDEVKNAGNAKWGELE